MTAPVRLHDVETPFGVVTYSGRKNLAEARADAERAFGRGTRVRAHREYVLCQACGSRPCCCASAR